MTTETGSRGPRTGDSIGPYRLHEEIGRGGMGVVYRARRADSGLDVALKLMLPELSSNGRFRERFVAEAQTSPKLDHPNIVQVHEAGEIDSELFIAMHLIDGVDLKQVIDREGRLATMRVLAILRQVSSALDYAHGSGVVHRDVKPNNILLSKAEDPSGEVVYITDFGLVKPAGSESTASRTGEVFGSIQYMSPEQVEGMPADGRSDVYSLACVAFEGLTGKIPFDRSNEVAVLWAHVHEEPPRVTSMNPDLPGGLDAALGNAMAKHPDDRYLTCGEFVEAFEEGLATKRRAVTMPIVKPLVSRVPRRKTEREVWAPNFFPELSRVRKLTNKTDWGRGIRVASVLALLFAGLVQTVHSEGVGGAARDVVDVAESVVSAVTATESDQELAGSTEGDGTEAPAKRRGKEGSPLSASGVSGAEEAFDLLPEAPVPTAGVDLGVEAEGSRLEEGSQPLEPLIVYSADQGPENSQLFVVRPDGSGRRQITNNQLQNWNPQWSPDGTRILFEMVSVFGSGGVVNTTVTDLYVVNADGSGLVRLTNDSDSDSEPAWSPDGTKIVFSEIDNVNTGSGSPSSIIKMNADGTGRQRLASGSSPEWSPDGRWIAYSADEGSIWIMKPDGSAARQVSSGGGYDADSSWSPDGKRIAFVRYTGTSSRPLYVVQAFGGDVQGSRPLVDYAQSPDWTPDGNSISYSSEYGDLYVINPDGTGNRLLIEGPGKYGLRDAAWRPTG